jgi:hypothetical protein
MKPTTSEIADLFWSQCWQLTVLILVVALQGATVCRRRPQLLHVLWVIVFVKSLTLPLWSSPTSVFSWLEPREAVAVVDYGYLAPAPSPFKVNAPNQLSIQPAGLETDPESRFFSTQRLIPLLIGIWMCWVAMAKSLART